MKSGRGVCVCVVWDEDGIWRKINLNSLPGLALNPVEPSLNL